MEEPTREEVADFLGDSASEGVLADYDAALEETVVGDDIVVDGVDSNVVDVIDTATTDTDTETVVETDDSKPESETVVEAKTDKVDEDIEADIESKSGKYTIPFKKLTDARDDRDTAKEGEANALAEVEKLKADIAKLTGAIQGKDPNGEGATTDTDQDEIDITAFKAEFPEAVELIEALKGKIDSLEQDNQQTQQAFQKADEDHHFDAIDNAHENAEEILTSKEFEDWVNGQNSIIKSAYIETFNNGTPTAVIEMLDAFVDTQSETVTKTDADKPSGKSDAEIAAEAAKKIEEAKGKETLPKSLSDVPGTASATDPAETLTTTANSGKAVDDLFAGKSQDKVNELVNKLLA